MESIDLNLLEKAENLSNEEVLELAILFSQAENIGPYHKHLQTIRKKYDERLEMLSFELQLLRLRDRLSDSELRKVYIGLEDVGYDSLFYDLLTAFQEDPNAGVYLRRLNSAFGYEPNEDECQKALRYISESGEPANGEGNPDPIVCQEFLPGKSQGECQKFMDWVQEKRNPMEGPGVSAIERYLVNRLSNISEYAEIPKYVQDFEIDLERISERQVEIVDLHPEKEISQIAETLVDSTLNIGLILSNPEFEDPRAEAIRILSKDLAQLPPEKLEKYLAPFQIDPNQIREIQEDPSLFRVYGPVNPHPEDDFSVLTLREGTEISPDLEKIYGGPRMFISMEYERDNDNDRPLEDWFVGYCYQCLRRIRERHYAIRRALIRGGWLGCYCSSQCVKASIVFDLGTDPDELKIVELEVALNAEIKTLLDNLGILERVERVKEVKQADRPYEPPQDILDMLVDGDDIE